MNKKLFLKLGVCTLVVMTPLTFVACGQKNFSAETSSSVNLDTDNFKSSSQDMLAESENGIVSLENTEQKVEKKVENTEQKVEKKSENAEQKVEKKPENIEQKVEDKQNVELKTKQEKEDFYYNIINEAMQKQINYINSIKDPKVKQSVQTSSSAAIAEATSLEMKYPEDSEIINECLAKVIRVN